MIRRFGLALTLACASALPAEAQSILGRSTGLSGAFMSFDFNGLPVALEGVAITNQLAGSGVSFTGAYFGPQKEPLYGPFPDGALYNYGNGQVFSQEIAVLFTNPTTGVAFNFATFPGTSTFKVWKDGAVVRSIVTTVPDVSPSNMALWWGFEFSDGTTFDRLTMTSDQGLFSPTFGFDNLQVSPVFSTVPEPGTVGLVAFGLFGVGATLRRRSMRRSSTA